MSEFSINGEIKWMGELQTFESGFQKVEFVVTTDDKYPQDLKFSANKEKADYVLKHNKVGDLVCVDFNIRGNEYKGNYYINLDAWKIATSDGSNFQGIKQENPGGGKAILTQKQSDQLNGEAAEDFNDNQRRLMNEEQSDLPF